MELNATRRGGGRTAVNSPVRRLTSLPCSRTRPHPTPRAPSRDRPSARRQTAHLARRSRRSDCRAFARSTTPSRSRRCVTGPPPPGRPVVPRRGHRDRGRARPRPTPASPDAVAKAGPGAPLPLASGSATSVSNRVRPSSLARSTRKSNSGGRGPDAGAPGAPRQARGSSRCCPGVGTRPAPPPRASPVRQQIALLPDRVARQAGARDQFVERAGRQIRDVGGKHGVGDDPKGPQPAPATPGPPCDVIPTRPRCPAVATLSPEFA